MPVNTTKPPDGQGVIAASGATPVDLVPVLPDDPGRVDLAEATVGVSAEFDRLTAVAIGNITNSS